MYTRRLSTNSYGEYNPSRSVLEEELEEELGMAVLSQAQRERKHSIISNAFSGRLARDLSLQTLVRGESLKMRGGRGCK